MRFLRSLLFIAALLCAGCSTIEKHTSDTFSTPPTLIKQTETTALLQSLPRARQPITISVYDFKDYTGQNKPAEVPQYSRAVTQGGVSILKKALLDAGSQRWFRVLERGGLEHLLQERKIIRSIRNQYTTSAGEKLPDIGPLLYSGMLLEGGIVAFDSNVLTGGVGARYLGLGTNSEYRRDVVTVDLRAVSVTSGEVLLAVSTSKTIFSTALSGGIFKFVSFDELLESEAGFTVNEPPQLAVRQAIEMAVYAMVMEGFRKELWQFADAAAGSQAFQQYIARTDGGATPRQPVRQQVTFKRNNAARADYTNKQRTPRASQATNFQSQMSKYPTKTPRKKKTSSAKTIIKPSQKTVSIKKSNQVAKKSAKQASSSLMGNMVPPGWYLQVASLKAFGNEGNKILSELKRVGLPVAVQEVNFESIRYYRILVGPYNDKNRALGKQRTVEQVSLSYGVPFLKRVY